MTWTESERAAATIVETRLKVGLEIHVELDTRTKMFTRAGNPACAEFESAGPNTLIDPVVLALPGALPVLNERAIELSIRVGLALGCSIAEVTRWDRKSYFYPDLPKGYQISQYALPLCYDGSVDWPIEAEGSEKRIGIMRAHLEEDAGKLLHEAPGGGKIDHSIVDLNRAGTPLLEIVTQPDFTTPEQVVNFARTLRTICRFVGASRCNMQQGHIRFEPNINCLLVMDDGRTVTTPITEIKNLNSFRSLENAIRSELAAQPERWRSDGREMGPGEKVTRGWDDAKGITFVQREKEDAHDYRYFPDPDLLPTPIDREWVDSIRAELPELPHRRAERYQREYALNTADAFALSAERAESDLFEAIVECVVGQTGGSDREAAAKQAANLLLQAGRQLANERTTDEEPPTLDTLGFSAEQAAGVVTLRLENAIGASSVPTLLAHLCDHDDSAADGAEKLGLVQVSDESALEAWCDEALADPANASSVADVKSGKPQAIGRLIGSVMGKSGGKADAKAVRGILLKKLGQ
ncbi:MAG: Asp-tRNA(Asn)/Glu-tRNA(Gln) amidotransferase subunit GatB [Phycisphaerales bacterium JB050]